MATFKHSGDMGDIIFSLPTIRALGGGTLYLDPEGGASSPLVNWIANKRTKFNRASAEFLRPLLLAQPYIQDVQLWTGQSVDHDLDLFRKHTGMNNLADSHLAAFNLLSLHRDNRWIDPIDPIKTTPIVISRSCRYHSNFSWWENNLPKLAPHATFVGLRPEYDQFNYTFGCDLRWYETRDVTTLAGVISGCELFVSNQGLPHAIAEGMKHKLVNEFYRILPSGIFQREGATYV